MEGKVIQVLVSTFQVSRNFTLDKLLLFFIK